MKTVFFWVVVILIGVSLGNSARGDAVIFINGDLKYGTATVLSATTIELEINGVTETINKKIIDKIIPGVIQPASGEIASSTDGKFVHKPSGIIYDITGDATTRKKMQAPQGKEYRVEVENMFDIPQFILKPATFSFYNRKGSYLVGAISNESKELRQSTEFRVSVFNQQDKLLGCKDFYIYRIPPNGRRAFEVALPDIPYDRIDKIRIVRKF